VIVIQAGHVNIADNCIWAIRADSGTEGEAAVDLAAAQQLAAALNGRGLPASVVDANFNCLDAAGLDYQAVIALHCGGPGVGVGHPEMDGAADRSQALAAALSKRLGIADRADQATDYYLFQPLSRSTPFVLVELGDVAHVESQLGDLVHNLYVGVLDWLGIPEVEPDPEWLTNLQPHQATIVLNRPVREIDLASRIAGVTVPGPLPVAFLTRTGEFQYYVPAETAQGAQPPIGWLKSEVDAAAGLSIPAPAPAPPAAAAPQPAAAPSRAVPPAQESAPTPQEAPRPPSARALALLRELQQALPDLITHLERQ
jgi:hypothetical protein